MKNLMTIFRIFGRLIVLTLVCIGVTGCSTYDKLSEADSVWITAVRNVQDGIERQVYYCKRGDKPVCTKVKFE